MSKKQPKSPKPKKAKLTQAEFDKALKAGIKAAEKVEKAYAAIHNVPPEILAIRLD